jgi:GntR family transcriptional repressor for pyruvate dehydrogenase complex
MSTTRVIGIALSGKTLAPPSMRLEASRLSDRLAALIEAQIDGGKLATGDRLPTEQQLAMAHGVSRTVVREAVHQLQSQGLVRSRQGSGVFVTRPPSHRALAFDPKLLESMTAVVQMVELRRVIEGEMAALAAVRATRTQLAALKRSLLAIDEATERGELGVEQDLAFHRAIAEATGNPQFVRLLGILEDYLRDAMTVTKGNESKRADFMAQVRREHRAILAAIVARNAKAARVAAIEHHLNGERRLIDSGVIKPSRVRSATKKLRVKPQPRLETTS